MARDRGLANFARREVTLCQYVLCVGEWGEDKRGKNAREGRIKIDIIQIEFRKSPSSLVQVQFKI